jgi:hypothetical protein
MPVYRPKLKMERGQTYTFDVSDSSNATHPFRFTSDSGSTTYSSGVTTSGTEGSVGGKVVFTVPTDAPDAMNYYCGTHGLGMGNKIKIVTPASGDNAQKTYNSYNITVDETVTSFTTNFGRNVRYNNNKVIVGGQGKFHIYEDVENGLLANNLTTHNLKGQTPTSYNQTQTIDADSDKIIIRETTGSTATSGFVCVYNDQGTLLKKYENVYSKQTTSTGASSVGIAGGKIAFCAGSASDPTVDVYSLSDLNTKLYTLRNVRNQVDGLSDHNFGQCVAMTEKYIAVSAPNADGYWKEPEWSYVYGQPQFSGNYGGENAGAVHIFSATSFSHLYTIENPGLLNMNIKKTNGVGDGLGTNIFAHQHDNDHYLLAAAPFDDINQTMSSPGSQAVGIVYVFKLLDNNYELIMTASDITAYGSFGNQTNTTYNVNNAEWGEFGLTMNYPYVAIQGNLRHDEDSGTSATTPSYWSAHYSGGVAVFDIRDKSHRGTIYNPREFNPSTRGFSQDYFGKSLALSPDGTVFASADYSDPNNSYKKNLYKIKGTNGFFQPADSDISTHSVSINGSNDYLQITGDAGWLNSPNGWTVEYWMKYNEQNGATEVTTYNPAKVTFYLTSDEPRVFTRDVNNDIHYTMQYGMRTSGGVQSIDLTGTAGPGADSDGVPGDDGPTRWHHRALVYKPAPHDRVYDNYLNADSHGKGGMIVNYVDGLIAGTNWYQPPIQTGSSTWTFGRNDGYSKQVLIRDFAIHHYPKYTAPFQPSLARPTIKDDTLNTGTKTLIVADANGYTDLTGNATITAVGGTSRTTAKPAIDIDVRDYRSYYQSRIWTDLDSATFHDDDWRFPFRQDKFLTKGAPSEGWQRIDNFSNLQDEKSYNIVGDGEGNIIVSGVSYTDKDMFVSSYDTYGNKLWGYYWNNNQNVDDNFPYDMAVDSKNNSITVGEDFHTKNFGPGLITKISSGGSVEFKKIFYDTTLQTPGYGIKIRGVDVDRHNNIITLAESRVQTNTYPIGAGGAFDNMQLSKFDSNGALTWAKQIGWETDSNYQVPNFRGNNLQGTIVKVDDSDNIFGTSYNARSLYDSSANYLYSSYYAVAFRTDSMGELQWHSCLQTNDSINHVSEMLYDINLFKSGDPVLSGYTTEGPADIRPCVVKLDKDTGSIKWQRVYSHSEPNTYTGITYNSAVDNDGNLYFGAIKATKALSDDPSEQFNIILKYDSDGNLLDQKKIRAHAGYFAIGDIEIDANNNVILSGDYEDSLYTSNHNLWLAKLPNTLPVGFYDSNEPGENQIYTQSDRYGIHLHIENVNNTSDSSNRLEVRSGTSMTSKTMTNMTVQNSSVSKYNLSHYGQNWQQARPTGKTIIKTPTNKYSGDRGIIFNGVNGAGQTPDNINQYLDLNNKGNAVNFGDASGINSKHVCAVSSGDAGRIVYNYNDSSGALNALDYINSANPAAASYFGDQTVTTVSRSTASNGTRGLFAGGVASQVNTNVIDYITIASTGNAADFGDAAVEGGGNGGISNTTYGIFQRGTYYDGSNYQRTNDLHYVTIATTGNSQDFGDLQTNKWRTCSMQDETRGVFAGGFTGDPDHILNYTNTMDYITIATPGNASDFGDLTSTRAGMAGMSNYYRGVMAGGVRAYNSQGYITTHNEIQYITIQTLGNAQDFGDLLIRQYYNGGSSGTPQ